jgi:hypothetical protein
MPNAKCALREIKGLRSAKREGFLTQDFERRSTRASRPATSKRFSDGCASAFGARGIAPRTFYFTDLDGNVLEARHYGE